MKFKTIKHKTCQDTFGYFEVRTDGHTDLEVYMGDVPQLYPMTSSLEGLKEYYKKCNLTNIEEAFENYEMIEVEVTTDVASQEDSIKLKTLEQVKFMFGIHSDASCSTNGYYSLCEKIEKLKTQLEKKPL